MRGPSYAAARLLYGGAQLARTFLRTSTMRMSPLCAVSHCLERDRNQRRPRGAHCRGSRHRRRRALRPVPGVRAGPAGHQRARRRFARRTRAGSAPSCIRTSRSTTSRRCRCAAAQELVDRLMQQIEPFKPQLSPGPGSHRVHAARGRPLPRWRTAGGTTFRCRRGRDRGRRRLVPAAAHRVAGIETFEGDAHPLPRARRAPASTARHLVIFGGGDSALDWALELAPRPRASTLVHRRRELPRRARLGGARCASWCEPARMRSSRRMPHALDVENGTLRGVTVTGPDGVARSR